LSRAYTGDSTTLETLAAVAGALGRSVVVRIEQRQGTAGDASRD
jgi:hypothetical protein